MDGRELARASVQKQFVRSDLSFTDSNFMVELALIVLFWENIMGLLKLKGSDMGKFIMKENAVVW